MAAELALASTASGQLHDLTLRPRVVGVLRDFQIRALAGDDPKRAYFARRGFSHAQLWHAQEGVSLLTPSRLTACRFELRWRTGRTLQGLRWSELRAEAQAGTTITLPTVAELVGIDRWFVGREETAEGRELRVGGRPWA